MRRRTGERVAAFLAGVALMAVVILIAALSVSAHFVTVHEGYENYPMNELVVFWMDNPLLSLAATAAALAACLMLHALIQRGRRFHADKLLTALWLLAAVFWLWGAGVIPRADSQQVVNAALQFAKDDFSVLNTQYFSDYSFQLGFCLPLEIFARLCPQLDLAMSMQMLNALMCAAMALVMGRFAQELGGGQRCRSAVLALYLLFLPMPFYCTYVYGTIPMLFFTSLAFLFFAKHAKAGHRKDGIAFVLSIAVAVMLKPNAMVPLIALCIAAVLLAMRNRKWEGLFFAAAAAALSVVLPKLVIWQYELRAGVKLCGDVSMLSRLVMGFQRSATGAGWFNNYTERFSPFVMAPQEARMLLLGDLREIFGAFVKAPGTLVQFMAEKNASLWLEPTYSVLWHGAVSDVTGRFNGLANMVYLETGALRLLLERVMDAFQQAMYVLACIGVGSALKKRENPLEILLPVTVLGGFLYHMLFEAKSQYIFVYAFFLMPLAAQGLTVLEQAIGKAYARLRKAS